MLEKFADEWGPEKIVEVYDPTTKMHGILVIDNTSLGPGKGGIRMTSTVSIEEVFRLARTMTWKCSLAGLPFGGAKSGIIIPKNLTETQKKDFIQAFARALRPLSPKQYIAAPDVNTSEKEMQWYSEANGSLKSCTGKPANMCALDGKKCGIPHEYGSTGFGVAHATAVAAASRGLEIKNAKIAVEGYGNVGTFTIKHLAEMGAKIVAVSDSKGCIYNSSGIDAEKLQKTKEKTGTVIKYSGEVISGKKIFELPVDILITAALPDVITKENVGNVKSKIIVEASNIPMTPEIEEHLFKKGVLVVPDFVANSGGVISSYAEYRGYHPTKMFELVERKLKANTKLVLNSASKNKVKPRDAGLIIAQDRVRKAMLRARK